MSRDWGAPVAAWARVTRAVVRSTALAHTTWGGFSGMCDEEK